MDSEYLALSAINQYSYCPRRCALIHLESEFEENRHTVAGTNRHITVDRPMHRMTEGVRLELAMPVWSHRLRVSGRCDVVEFHEDGKVVPVEYKLGKRKRWINDDLQVVAQALCLEEMLKIEISEGAVFHHKSRRLRPIKISQQLREEVENTLEVMHRLIEPTSILPPPTDKVQKCGECSLIGVCQPELWRGAMAIVGAE